MAAVNITSASVRMDRWQPGNTLASLDVLFTYVEAQAIEASSWYWTNKVWKARLSRWVRLWALLLTAVAGLLPVGSFIAAKLGLMSEGFMATSGLWASLLVGLAAALLGVDRAFGLSSGWARYVLAATDIGHKLAAFRMDWLAHMAASGGSPSREDVLGFVQRARDFRMSVEAVVAQETRDWVAEFQTNATRLESDVKAQLDAARAKGAAGADAPPAGAASAAQPGSLSLTLDGAGPARNLQLSLTVEGTAGLLVDAEPLAGARTWSRLNLTPGHYRVAVMGTDAGGTPVMASAIADVKAGEVVAVALVVPGG